MTAPGGQHLALHAKWVEWTDRCWAELNRMHRHRAIWRGMLKALQEQNESQPDQVPWNEWWLHYTRLYQAGQVMGLRRLTDPSDDVVSLPRLISALKANPRVIADSGRPSPDHETFDAMLTRLKHDCAEVRAAADRRYAHNDASVWDGTMSPAQIHEALDAVTEEFRAIAIIVKGSDHVMSEYVGDWQRPFRQPLFEPSPHDRRIARWL